MIYPPLIVILGPTASGKSELALALACDIDGEIISADSRQIYKSLDIGTAKPTLEERSLVPHHLVDMVELLEDFNLKDFQRLALNAISKIYARGKRPLMVGGSALYIKAVTDGLDLPVTPPNEEFRQRMRDLAIKEGTDYLYEILKKADPLTAGRLHHNDLRRIVRALEVFEATSESLFTLQNKRKILPFRSLKIGINWQRDLLYERINERVDRMFETGFIDEVRFLLSRGYSFGLPPLDALGYPETADYLKGKATLPEAIRLIKRNTRHFSKRQMTWFRKDKEICWLNPGEEFDVKKILEEIKSFLEENNGL